jgi:AcrR family transcriptional regulator
MPWHDGLAMSNEPQASAPTARFHEKREAILGAAALLFNEQGVKGATLSHIARSVGLVTNSVTYYYRKKEDLATACFMRSIAVFEGLAEAAARQPEPALRVRAFLGLLADLLAGIERGSHAPTVTFNDVRALPSPQAEDVFGAYTDMFRRVRGLLRGPGTEGLARDDLNARAHQLLSLAHWMRWWIGRYEVDQYPRVAERVADILLGGMAGPSAAWPAGDGQAAWKLVEPGAEASTDAFLRAATVLVNEQGYRGASVDKISARLHVTKGSFYHHNDNKDDLISACFERSFAVMRRALQRAETEPGSGWSRVCAVSRALVQFQLADEGPLLRSTAMSALPDQAQRAQVRQTVARLTERMGGLLVDGMADGSVRALDPAIAAQIAFGAINAAAELRRWVPHATVQSVAGLYVRPMLCGVLSAAEPAPLSA